VLINKIPTSDNSQLFACHFYSFSLCNMESSIAAAAEGERHLQSPFFSKLGNYFDRPEWWEEGAATLSAFFHSTPAVDTLDQRLEDLLDLLEPPKIAEEPPQSTYPGVVVHNSTDQTAHNSLLHQEQESDCKLGDDQFIQSNSDSRSQTNIISPSNDLLPSANAAHIDHQKENRSVPAIAKPFKHLWFLSEDRVLPTSLSVLNANSIDNAVGTSSPNCTGATTSTRQTSPRPRSSTRASSVEPGILEIGPLAPLSFEATKAVSALGTVTVHHRATPTSEDTTSNNDVTSTDLVAAIQDDAVSDQLAHGEDPVTEEQSGTADDRNVTPEHDVTGLQAIKNELSDEYGVPNAIDSSILTQDTDITVVHDPSSAAISFSPPNPYMDIPSDSNLDTTEIPVGALSTRFGNSNDDNDEIDEELSADSSLTSLATNEEQLPQSHPERPSDLKVWRNVTPSPPPTSPLTPPPGWIATRHTDQDDMGGADSDGDVDVTPSAMSTPHKPMPEPGKVLLSTSRNKKGLKIVTEPSDGLARNTGKDEADMPTPSMVTLSGKRKQDEPHTEESSRKRRLCPSTTSEKQLKDVAELVFAPEDEINEGTLEPIRRTKGKARRDSPDELAPESPDELANIPASNFFGLKNTPLSLAKPKLSRSTATRSRARKPIDTSIPLRKLVGIARATRGAVGNKELAGLLRASPPRKAEEKTNVDLGGRLRSHARSPESTLTLISAPVPSHAATTFPVSTTEDMDAITTEIVDTSETDKPSLTKRKRPPGGHPLGALELKELGSTPILETRTRARTATVEPTPEPVASQSAIKPAPKRARLDLSATEVAAPDTVVSAPEPALKAVPVKHVRKPVVRLDATPTVSSPFNLAAKSKGAPTTSRKKAPAKPKVVNTDKDLKTDSAKLVEALTKRKRGNEGNEDEKGATRASKRIAGTGPEEN
jgi:hypothetical protein